MQYETKKIDTAKTAKYPQRLWSDRNRCYSVFALDGALVALLIPLTMKMPVSSSSRGIIFQAVCGL